jgi:hypothetical protein
LEDLSIDGRVILNGSQGNRMVGGCDNIKMYFQDVGWGGMDWIDLAQDRNRWRAVVNAVMNIRVP